LSRLQQAFEILYLPYYPSKKTIRALINNCPESDNKQSLLAKLDEVQLSVKKTNRSASRKYVATFKNIKLDEARVSLKVSDIESKLGSPESWGRKLQQTNTHPPSSSLTSGDNSHLYISQVNEGKVSVLQQRSKDQGEGE
jgi:hypothetical protein